MEPRYIRKPEHDRRLAHGDDHAGDAWLDTETGQLKWVAVGVDPNNDAILDKILEEDRSNLDKLPEEISQADQEVLDALAEFQFEMPVEMPEFEFEPIDPQFRIGEIETPPDHEVDSDATTGDVARWMKQAVEDKGVLYHQQAVGLIRRFYGDRFLYTNRHGNPAIVRDVLKAFLILTRDSVVWSRKESLWRLRQPGDPAGARMVDY